MLYLLDVTLNSGKEVKLKELTQTEVNTFVTQAKSYIESNKDSIFTVTSGRLKPVTYYIRSSEVAFFSVSEDKLGSATSEKR
jgi:hypothetical protein